MKASDHGGHRASGVPNTSQAPVSNTGGSLLPDQRAPSTASAHLAAAAGDGERNSAPAAQPSAGALSGSTSNPTSPVQPTKSLSPGTQGAFTNHQAVSPPVGANSAAAMIAGNGALVNGSSTSGGKPADLEPAGSAYAAAQQQLTDMQLDAQQPARQWDRSANPQPPSALASTSSSRQPSQTGRSVKFAATVPDSEDGSTRGDDSNQRLSGSEGGAAAGSSRPSKRSMPRRSISSSALRSSGPPNEVSEAVLAKQAEILRSNKAGKLRMRRGGLDSSFAALQDALTQNAEPLEHVATRVSSLNQWIKRL